MAQTIKQLEKEIEKEKLLKNDLFKEIERLNTEIKFNEIELSKAQKWAELRNEQVGKLINVLDKIK